MPTVELVWAFGFDNPTEAGRQRGPEEHLYMAIVHLDICCIAKTAMVLYIVYRIKIPLKVKMQTCEECGCAKVEHILHVQLQINTTFFFYLSSCLFSLVVSICLTACFFCCLLADYD